MASAECDVFLTALAEHGNVTMAARQAGFSATVAVDASTQS